MIYNIDSVFGILTRQHEEKKKIHENDEQKRRSRILKMRKMKLDAATEQFQRKPEKKRPPVHEKNIGGKLTSFLRIFFSCKTLFQLCEDFG